MQDFNCIAFNYCWLNQFGHIGCNTFKKYQNELWTKCSGLGCMKSLPKAHNSNNCWTEFLTPLVPATLYSRCKLSEIIEHISIQIKCFTYPSKPQGLKGVVLTCISMCGQNPHLKSMLQLLIKAVFHILLRHFLMEMLCVFAMEGIGFYLFGNPLNPTMWESWWLSCACWNWCMIIYLFILLLRRNVTRGRGLSRRLLTPQLGWTSAKPSVFHTGLFVS